MEMQRVSIHKEFYEACSPGKRWQMPAMQKYRVQTYSVRRALFLPSNVPRDFSRSPHENDDSIHEFAEAIIFDPTASMLVANISASGQSAAGWRVSRWQHRRGSKRPLEPYDRHIQHRSRFLFAECHHHWEVQHCPGRRHAPCKYWRQQYRHRCRDSFE